ncbi:hypothetical protein PABG_02466 [Paracoccidioides brasiliensis Pb03]|nr:hypothetical protein PABG_02466 [Paracoccidioides brasiliensis Pb03]
MTEIELVLSASFIFNRFRELPPWGVIRYIRELFDEQTLVAPELTPSIGKIELFGIIKESLYFQQGAEADNLEQACVKMADMLRKMEIQLFAVVNHSLRGSFSDRKMCSCELSIVTGMGFVSIFRNSPREFSWVIAARD